MTFDTLTNFYCYFYRKRNSKCLLYKYCKNNKTVSELHLHARDIIHCNYAFLCAALIFTENMFFREKFNLFFCSLYLFLIVDFFFVKFTKYCMIKSLVRIILSNVIKYASHHNFFILSICF